MLKKSLDSPSRSSSLKQGSEIMSRKSIELSDSQSDNEEEKLEPGKEKVTAKTETIKVGDYLPYGPSLSYETPAKVVRIKDIGVNRRLLLVGVIGSFTPECWNRHLFRVLGKLRYYEERNVDFICCVSTNDPFVQRAWAEFLGCEEIMFMWSDFTGKFTKALGMDVVIPWLDNTVRSKRYVILAEDMVVTKMIMAPCDSPEMKWQCEHLDEDFGEGYFDEFWT